MDAEMPDDYEPEPEAQAVEQAEQADEQTSPKCEAARAVVLAKLRAAGR